MEGVTMTAVLAGGLIGSGLALAALTLRPARPSLIDDLTHLHSPAPAPDPQIRRNRGRWVLRVGRPGAVLLARLGLPRPTIRHDLALLGITPGEHLAEQAALAATGLVILPLTVLAGGLGGIASALVAAAAGAAGGFWLADRQVHTKASSRRAQLRHALSAYLDLVVLAVDGGAGIDQALADSAAICHGWGPDQLRGALRTARLTRTTPWSALARLGEDTGVSELTELAATAGLAGTEGARIRASLATRATALRARLLAATETRANQATERMSIPMFILAAGFLLLIAYPALAGVLLAV